MTRRRVATLAYLVLLALFATVVWAEFARVRAHQKSGRLATPDASATSRTMESPA